MRVLPVLCVFVIAINYLGNIRGAGGADVTFSLSGVTSTTYSKFLEAIRAKLKAGTSHGIPLLPQSVATTKRFILVDLSNYDNKKITVPIDVLNVYVVGYRVVNSIGKALFYYLRQDDSSVPISTLFTDIKGTDRKQLSFTGSYTDLERAAGQGREKIPLGGSPLNTAIDRLLYADVAPSAVAQSLIVIIQMVSEATRYGFIERQIGNIIQGDRTYTPGPATLSLENKWSPLSTQIQLASATGEFKVPVELRNTINQPFLVKDVKTATKVTSIALLLYRSAKAAADLRSSAGDYGTITNPNGARAGHSDLLFTA